jgi:tetratricopeptide (TPR) repeat protein
MERARHLVRMLDSFTRAGDSAEAVRAVAQADSILAVAQTTDKYWVDPHIERAQLAFQSVRLPGTSLSSIRPELVSGSAHAEAALELEPNAGRALEIRGTLRYWRWLLNLTRDSSAAATLLASAETDLVAAASRERSRAGAWNVLSHLLLNRSQLARAAAAAERALELDPFLPNADKTIYRIFTVSMDEGYADQATRWCGEGQRHYPKDFRFVECGLWLYGLPGSKPDMSEVWTRYDQYRAMSPTAFWKFNALKGRMIVAMAAGRAQGVGESRLVDGQDVVVARPAR